LHSPNRSWSYSGADGVCVAVDKAIKLHGVQHFGSEGGEYTVSAEVKDVANNSSLVKQSGSYSSEKDKTYPYYGFDVLFNPTVSLEGDKTYEIVSLIKGTVSWYGEEGKTSVECREVQFTFEGSATSSNGTSVFRGQFPVFLFSLSC